MGQSFLRELAQNILAQTNYANNCHGLQSVESAAEIARHYFEAENLSFDGWQVREIPLVDNSGEYPVSIVLCVCNRAAGKEIDLCLSPSGELVCVGMDCGDVEVSTISEAIGPEKTDKMIKKDGSQFTLAEAQKVIEWANVLMLQLDKIQFPEQLNNVTSNFTTQEQIRTAYEHLQKYFTDN